MARLRLSQSKEIIYVSCMTTDRNHVMSFNIPLTSHPVVVFLHSRAVWKISFRALSHAFALCLKDFCILLLCDTFINEQRKWPSILRMRKEMLLLVITVCHLVQEGEGGSYQENQSCQVIGKVIDLKTCICSTDMSQQLMW